MTRLWHTFVGIWLDFWFGDMHGTDTDTDTRNDSTTGDQQ